MNVNCPKFLLNHTVMYEIMSMKNGKYIVWKLLFPRVGDSLFTVDKLMDLNVWEELYGVLMKISVKYGATESLASLVPQIIDKNRFKLCFKEIQMNVEQIRDLFNVDVKLIHAVLNADLLLNNDNNQKPVAGLTNGHTNATSSSGENNQMNSQNASAAVKENNSKRPFRPSSSDEEILSIPSPASKIRKVHTSLQSTTRSSQVQPGSATKIAVHSDSESSDSDASDKSPVDTESTSSNKNVDIPKNLPELRVLMNDIKYLERFGYEDDEKKFRFFDDIYFIDGEIGYAVFHSSKVIDIICGRKDCTLYFYFSQELCQQFNSFSEVKFTDVNHVLMVFLGGYQVVNPFGFFLLPDKDESLGNVPMVINGWLKRKQCPTNVTKCITPYNPILQRSIAGIWPKAKIIGCSAEYHKEIKDFAKQNKGLGAEHKTKLTRLACSLCFLDKKYFSVGVQVIEKYSVSDYGVKLIQHLRTKWLGVLTSADSEWIMHRSLIICQQFSKQIERDYFLNSTYGRAVRVIRKHKHVWEFIEFLQTLTGAGILASKNTDLQKEKEQRYRSAWAEFNENVKIMSELKAVEQFMLEVSLNM